MQPEQQVQRSWGRKGFGAFCELSAVYSVILEEDGVLAILVLLVS